jgi:paraquat-inducible protein A
MLQASPGTLACPHCDLLVQVGGLRGGQVASCPRCGGFLTRRRVDAVDRTAACALAALVLLALSCSFPFLSFSQSGLVSRITLFQTPGMLWENGLPAVAALIAAFIIVIPALVMLLMLAVCLVLRSGRWHPWLVPAGRWAFHLRHWAMVEVFIIGVIVSLVKIAHMATVGLGISFWSYIAFSITFTFAVATIDRYQTWSAIERMARLGETAGAVPRPV